MYYKFIMLIISGALIFGITALNAATTGIAETAINTTESLLLVQHKPKMQRVKHKQKMRHKRQKRNAMKNNRSNSLTGKPWTGEESGPWSWGKQENWQDMSPEERTALKAEHWSNWKRNIKNNILDIQP